MATQWPANKHSGIDAKRNAFFSAIHDWLSANLEKVYRIYNYGEGWEKWMQTDWADHLRLTYGNNITVQREKKAWINSDNLLDFAIFAGGLGYVMELKCNILKDDSAAWRGHLDGDYEKINHTVKDTYTSYAKWIIGIRFDQIKAPGGAWNYVERTATSPTGNQITYYIDYRTLGGF